MIENRDSSGPRAKLGNEDLNVAGVGATMATMATMP
jgi:hypothetical protein